ncbi:MAG: hypothetical protein K1X91_15940 [Bacteriodetes bacterium]|nr:hypothetical protein [Bacteroidota bacterium]
MAEQNAQEVKKNPSFISKLLSVTNQLNGVPRITSIVGYWLLFVAVVEIITVVIVSVGFNATKEVTLWSALANCLAAQFVGVIIGFLFGFPKSTPPDTTKPSATPSFTNNTNLEQISDWLTKIIISASLVEFREIFRYYLNAGCQFGVMGTPEYRFGLALILFSLIAGFLAAYIFTSIILSHELNQLLDETKENAQTAAKAITSSITNQNEVNESDNEEQGEIQVQNVDAALVDVPKDNQKEKDNKLRSLAESYTPVSKTFDSDPWFHKFGQASNVNGVTLSATVQSETSSLYKVVITLTGDENNLPNGSLAIIFIHPTFYRYKRYFRVKNNMVQLTLYSVGSFTVGALVNGGDTKLELNLAELPGVPKKFKDT